ncbi:hypothetical protein DV736_g3846, partial [Chaetothyriales sp. CBS 134916]
MVVSCKPVPLTAPLPRVSASAENDVSSHLKVHLLNGSVTRASSGFGRASDVMFAEEGASIVVADITEKPLSKGFEDDLEHSTPDLIRNKGGQATFVKCDVTKAHEVDIAILAAVKAFGRLGVMLNNAGIYRGGKLMDQFTEADLDVTYNVNVKGMFFGVHVTINLVSTVGLQGYPSQSVYNISKGAQANLTRCAAIESGREGIRLMRTLAESVPLKRWGEESDVANLALYLASDESSYLHGDLIGMDGGETLCRSSF